MRALVALSLAAGCAAARPSIIEVRDARYDAELTVVYAAVREAVISRKRDIDDDDPGAGKLVTGWSDIEVKLARAAPIEKFRLRLEIEIVGARPWQVIVKPIVIGTDSSNVRAHYAERMELAIHERLRAYVVKR